MICDKPVIILQNMQQRQRHKEIETDIKCSSKRKCINTLKWVKISQADAIAKAGLFKHHMQQQQDKSMKVSIHTQLKDYTSKQMIGSTGTLTITIHYSNKVWQNITSRYINKGKCVQAANAATLQNKSLKHQPQ